MFIIIWDSGRSWKSWQKKLKEILGVVSQLVEKKRKKINWLQFWLQMTLNFGPFHR